MSKEPSSPSLIDLSFGSKTTLHSKAENILRQSTNLMMDANSLFGDTLDPIQTSESTHALSLLLEKLQDEAQQIVRGVRLNLNDYAKMLGIGLMSTSMEPYAGNGKPGLNKPPIIIPGHEKCQTIGMVPNLDLPRRIVGFRPDIAEVLIALSKELHVGDYQPEDLKDLREPLTRGKDIMVDNKGLVGVPLPIIDAKKLEASGLPFGREISPEELQRVFKEFQEIYLCQYLTRAELAARLMCD